MNYPLRFNKVSELACLKKKRRFQENDPNLIQPMAYSEIHDILCKIRACNTTTEANSTQPNRNPNACCCWLGHRAISTVDMGVSSVLRLEAKLGDSINSKLSRQPAKPLSSHHCLLSTILLPSADTAVCSVQSAGGTEGPCPGCLSATRWQAITATSHQ